MRNGFPLFCLVSCLCLHLAVGCASSRKLTTHAPSSPVESEQLVASNVDTGSTPHTNAEQIQRVFFQDNDGRSPEVVTGNGSVGSDEPSVLSLNDVPSPLPTYQSDLNLLIDTALDQNPRLGRLYQEYQAAANRSQYANKLPDPKLGANVFGNPIETAAGSQRANMSLSQAIPWLGRLNAQQQQAFFEAYAIREEYAAERLRVISGIRVGWYRLYVIDRQIETTEANQELLKSLIDVANARIAIGNASQGDVLLGTLELSKLQKRLLTLRRQRRSVEAEVNRLIGRNGETPVSSSRMISVGTIELDSAAIHRVALESQPEIEAARLRTQATRWGIEVARLQRRPEFMLSASYFFTDGNRPASPIVNVGEDPWALGVQVSLPVWQQKYDAMENEAGWKHQAAFNNVADLSDRYDALILDLLAESKRAAETAELYKTTILPQARQTLTADQESFVNGNVEFDRVVQDYRNLLTLELGYHQAVGELAIANARIQQAAGRDLDVAPQVEVETN